MTMSSNQVVRRFYEMALTGRVQEMLALVDPAVRVIEAPSLPYGGTFEGIEGLLKAFQIVFATWKDCQITLQEVVGEGEWVVGLSQMSGTSSATGKAFKQSLAEVFRVVNGKVLEIKPFYFDTKILYDIHHG